MIDSKLARLPISALISLLLAACSSTSGKGSNDETGGQADAGGGQTEAGGTGGSGGAQQNTGGVATSAGAGGEHDTNDAGITDGDGGTDGSLPNDSGGASGAGGASGTSDAGGLTGIVKIMVLGSSNELITCWRAFLWQKLHADQIENFDFVGGVTDGPDCNVPGYDKDLQAQSGIIVSNLTAETFAGWFSAHPPDIVLMHFGGADLLANMPVDGVLMGYSLALQQMRLVNPQVRLMIAQHTPQSSASCNDCVASTLQLNTDIVTWAAQNTTSESPITVVDLYTGLDPVADFSDGVHLNESGSNKVSDRWLAALVPLFKP